jgi:predicted PurR-regulated permease PerM
MLMSDQPTFPPSAPPPGDVPLTPQVMQRLLRQQIYFAVLVGAIIWFLISARHVIPLFIFSFLVAYLLKPVVGILTRNAQRRHGFSRTGAILAVYGVLVLVLSGGGWFVTGKVVAEIHALSSNFPALRSELILHVHQSEKSWPFSSIPPAARISIDNTINNLDQTVGKELHAVAPEAVHEVPGLLELLVVPIMAYYFLKDGGDFLRFPRNLLPEYQRARFDVLIEEIDQSLRGYLKGQITLSLVAAAVVYVVLFVFRVKYAYLVSIAAFFLELIPVVGPLVWAALAVLLTYIQHPGSAVFVLILVVLAHQFDMHILGPRILGGHLRLHPAVVIFALVTGNAIFGLLGALLAAPVAAVLTIVVRYLIEEGALSTQAVIAGLGGRVERSGSARPAGRPRKMPPPSGR